MITYSKALEERITVDVFVAGGGPAGVAAAIAAAKQGKKVFIAEAGGCFGGSSTQNMVPEFMNFGDGEHFMAGGIGQEVITRLFGEAAHDRRGYFIKAEKVKRLYDDMIQENGIDFLFFAKVVDVIKENDRVTHAVVSGKGGLYAVSAEMFIDCTGDGSLSVLSGADYLFAENGAVSPTTLCSVWAGADFDKRENIYHDGANFMKAYNDGVFSQYDTVLPGIKPVDPERGYGVGNVGHVFKVDDTSDRSVSDAMIFARNNLKEYEFYYNNYVPGFKNVALEHTANVLGVRESRRIMCDTYMTVDKFDADFAYPDEIGRYSYPVDIHPETPDKEGMQGFTQNTKISLDYGQNYSIPYGALAVKGVDNVLVAGKCISADRSMQASVRVIPGCFITGQAAGVAAAVCCDNKTTTHNADIKAIQQKLIAMGAYLPNPIK